MRSCRVCLSTPPIWQARSGPSWVSLTRHSSWDFEVDEFVNGLLVSAMETPLGAGDESLPLCVDLDPRRMLKELDFELPLRHLGLDHRLG